MSPGFVSQKILGVMCGAFYKKHTHKRVMKIIGENAAKLPEMSLAEALAKIKEKSEWLRIDDKQKLSQRYSCSVNTVNRHITGKTRKINVKLVADALEIAVERERLICSRLS